MTDVTRIMTAYVGAHGRRVDAEGARKAMAAAARDGLSGRVVEAQEVRTARGYVQRGHRTTVQVCEWCGDTVRHPGVCSCGEVRL